MQMIIKNSEQVKTAGGSAATQSIAQTDIPSTGNVATTAVANSSGNTDLAADALVTTDPVDPNDVAPLLQLLKTLQQQVQQILPDPDQTDSATSVTTNVEAQCSDGCLRATRRAQYELKAVP